MRKLLLPLLLIAVSGLAAEPPGAADDSDLVKQLRILGFTEEEIKQELQKDAKKAEAKSKQMEPGKIKNARPILVVKSKAAQELLKHPEFKKAMELVPEFTKAALKALDKFAPAPKKPIDPGAVARVRAAIGIKDKYDGKYEEVDEDPFKKGLRTTFKGMTREQVIALLGKPDQVNDFGAGVFNYRIEKKGKFTETKYHHLGFYFEIQGTGVIFNFAALFESTIK